MAHPCFRGAESTAGWGEPETQSVAYLGSLSTPISAEGGKAMCAWSALENRSDRLSGTARGSLKSTAAVPANLLNFAQSESAQGLVSPMLFN